MNVIKLKLSCQSAREETFESSLKLIVKLNAYYIYGKNICFRRYILKYRVLNSVMKTPNINLLNIIKGRVN